MKIPKIRVLNSTLKQSLAGFLPVPHPNHPEPRLIFPTL